MTEFTRETVIGLGGAGEGEARFSAEFAKEKMAERDAGSAQILNAYRESRGIKVKRTKTETEVRNKKEV